MAFLGIYLHLLWLLVVPLAAISDVDLLEDCPASPEGIVDDVIQAACAYVFASDEAASFRNETRSRHDAADKTDQSNRYEFVRVFSPLLGFSKCNSRCKGLDRENVTWCVRLADVNRTIETCVSLDDNNELVFESTCDALDLELETYLSLPTAGECGFLGHPGCLGLTNLHWFFKDAYLTCISENESCRDVGFSTILARSNSDQPPKFNEITPSLVVQPSEQVVIRAEVTLSGTPSVFVSWRHNNATYEDHIPEDPICGEGDCGNFTGPDGPMLRSNRIRSYVITRTVNRECVGSSIYSLETYLIIDDARETDAGTYQVKVIPQLQRGYATEEQVNVSIVCDETTFFKAKCSNLTIAMNKGGNTRWYCSFNAPHYLNVSVVQNKSIPVEKSDLRGKENLKDICYSKEPTAVYDVVEEELHTCFSKYTVQVIVCSTSESVVGSYIVVWGEGSVAEGSAVRVKLIPSAVSVKLISSAVSVKLIPSAVSVKLIPSAVSVKLIPSAVSVKLIPSAVSVKLIPSSGLSTTAGSSKKDSLPQAVYIVPVVCLILALTGIIIVLVVLIRRRKRKRSLGHLSQLQSPDPITSPEAVFYKKNGQFSPISLLSPQSASVYSDPLEFPRNQLYVFTKKVLGEGSFGRVLQAKAEGIVPGMPERNIVAIKTTKENATSVEIEELLAELDLMKNMKPHENILNLLGQCTTPGGPVCLIVEYARYGNLRDFLRQCEEVVLSLNHKPHVPRHRSRTGTFSSSSAGSFQPLLSRQDSSVFTPGSAHHQQFVFPFPSPPSAKMSTSSSSSTADSKSTAHHPNTSVPLAHSVAPIGHDYINSRGLVYMEDVHNFALQIACGLQHLAGMEIVHCDLAARNVLIAEGFVLKIADFGLARDISGREMYKKNPRGEIPVKWTAPEALENRIFTIKSDVWSFGVVLWELFTYGHTPYPDLHLGQSYDAIISYLKEGNRMTQPDSCSDSFYELMLKCWSLDPDERPTPIDLVATLTPLDQPCLQDLKEVENETKSNVEENGKH